MSRNILAQIPEIRFTVYGGLDYIRGNKQPHFSLTYWRGGEHGEGGCDHSEIIRRFPQFSNIAALHLSDMDGVPIHAESNGWYWMAGALPEHAGERYHGGNQEQHFPKPEGAPRRGTWDNTDYRKPTPDECLAIMADHFRITHKAASGLRDAVIEWAKGGMELRRQTEKAGAAAAGVYKFLGTYDWAHARREFAKWVEAQRPRWKAEADACIAKHGLVVTGDKWEMAG
jgi:hypothetical protein